MLVGKNPPGIHYRSNDNFLQTNICGKRRLCWGTTVRMLVVGLNNVIDDPVYACSNAEIARLRFREINVI